MADVPRVKLSELIGRFGVGLSGDARRSKALLADVCGSQYRGECAVLVAAIEEGVAGELRSNSSGLPTEVLLDRLSQRLQAHRGVAADLARWGVESWAIALGVVAAGDTLATFKMDGLAPLIDVAGADGAISAAGLDHLVLEATARGVSEADARAYLARYAAARGWQLGAPAGGRRARRKAVPAPTAPQPPASPPPQAQPLTPPPPDRSFRWVATCVIGLAAIVIIALVARVKEQPQPAPPQPTTAPIPAPAPDALKQQQTEREQRTYNAARGNLSALQVYLNSCTVCAFADEARSEIGRLQTAEQEEHTYKASRGNKYALQAYLNVCAICAYASAARSEITALEVPRETPSPGTNARYQRSDCGSIIDATTGLQWYLGPDTYMSWAQAAQWVRQLPTCGGGWALPASTQLKTLFDRSVSAGTGFYTDGRYWPAHIDPIFSAIGSGSWVWADGFVDNATAPAVNFNQGIAVRLATSDPHYTVRAFAVKAAPALPSQPTGSYAQGASDWDALHAWFDAQTGDRRAGADYWAANRNRPNHKSCSDAAFDYPGTPGFEPRGREGYIGDDDLVEFGAGCLAAKTILDPIDARRADPQYRAGFNDEAQRLPINATFSPASLPAVPQPTALAPQGTTAAYARGVADWDALRGWFNLQAGDRRAGADYWATNRNVANHKSCGDAAMEYASSPAAEPGHGREGYKGDDDIAEFEAGCQAAKSILDPIDLRRTDPQYRAGFNDEATRSPLAH